MTWSAPGRYQGRGTTESARSRLVLGPMMVGTGIDEDTSFALLDRFVGRGGTWIATADCSAFWATDTGHGGDSERVLGRWLAADAADRSGWARPHPKR